MNRIWNTLNRINQVATTGNHIGAIVHSHNMWIYSLGQSFLFNTPFDGELDPAECSWGIWRYSNNALDDPHLRELIYAVDHPHARLHLDAAEALRLREQGLHQEAFAHFQNEVAPHVVQFTTAIGALSSHHQGLLVQHHLYLRQVVGEIVATIILISVTGFLVFLLMAVIIPKNILKPIRGLVSFVEDAADGNADSEIDRKNITNDEIGIIALSIQDMLREIVTAQKMNKVIMEAANILLTSKEETNMTSLLNGIEVIGRFLNVDRTQVWHQEDRDGELCFVLQYEWVSELGKQKRGYPPGFVYRRSNDAKWFNSTVLNGKNVNSPISELPPVIEAYYASFDVVSTAIFPMISDNEIIGFFAVQDCDKVRTFTPAEMDIMASAGLMFTSVFNRMQQAEMLKKQQANEMAQTYLDASPMCIEIRDASSNLLYCNRQVLEMLELSSMEEYNQRFAEFSTEYQPCGTPSEEKFAQQIEMVLTDGSANFEWTHLNSKGELLTMDVAVVRIMQENEPVIVSYSHDLRTIKSSMEREREAEMALHEQKMNERMRLILDAGPISISWYDAERKLIDCNDGAVNLFEYYSKAELGKALSQEFHTFFPANQPCGISSLTKSANMMNTAENTGYVRDEVTFRTKHGEDFPSEVVLARVDYDDTFMIVEYIMDLRKEKTALEHEREAGELAKLFMETSPTFIEIWDADGNLIECNNQVVDFFGLSHADEFIEKYEQLSPKYQPCGTPTMIKAAAYVKEAFEKGSAKFEWMHLTLSGEELPVETSFVHKLLKGKDIIIGYSHDLRPMRKIVAEMQRSKIAEESNLAKSRFLARMSHEIRTPITAVMGVAEIELQGSNIPPRTEEAFVKIHSSANQLLALVNDVLDLSKIEAGKMELLTEEYEVASMIVDVSQLHAVFGETKNIKFNLHVDENIPTYLVGDVMRIGQILNNLLSNAFKYTESGAVDLSLRFEGDVLVISVKDTGYGMTPEQLQDLTNEYTRYHELSARNIEGTGLGMPIVFSLVQMMDAKINVDSQVDVGTTVEIRIPQQIIGTQVLGKELAQSLQRFDEVMNAAGKRFDFEPESMPYGSVLVVDDVDANLYVAKGLLAFYDLKIETCTNGYDAIKLVESGKTYDIIFLDHMMPGINGTETMKQLRGLGYSQPIVALTANAMIGQAEEFMRSGFDGFISKPIQTKRLNETLMKHIRDKQPPEIFAAAGAKVLSKLDELSEDTKPIGNIHDFQSDPQLVLQLRQDFGRRNKNAYANICQAIESGDFDTAHRMAHTVKGLAGMILEPHLEDVARIVEESLSADKAPPAAQLSALGDELTRILADIGDTEMPAQSGEQLDTGKAYALLEEVEPLLVKGNTAAVRMLDELRKIKNSENLCAAIDGFDFKAALNALQVLKEKFEGR